MIYLKQKCSILSSQEFHLPDSCHILHGVTGYTYDSIPFRSTPSISAHCLYHRNLSALPRQKDKFVREQYEGRQCGRQSAKIDFPRSPTDENFRPLKSLIIFLPGTIVPSRIRPPPSIHPPPPSSHRRGMIEEPESRGWTRLINYRVEKCKTDAPAPPIPPTVHAHPP